MVLLFNSLRKLKDWKLSTENNKAGKFDDAILESPESAFLIQAKNKEKTNSKITLNALLSTNPNNSFSLPKYFLSYQEVKNQFKGKNTIIICTNAGFDKTALEFLDTRRICTESVLYCADDNCSSHTFNLNILSRLKGKVEIYCQDKNIDQSVNTDNNLKDFLKRLQFYSNYPLGNNNKDKDTEILVSLLNCSGNFYGHISCSEIYAKLMKWFQQKHGIYLTETTVNAMFLEIKSDQYWQKLDKYGVSFQGHLLNVQDKTQLYYVNAEGGYLLQELRIHHSLRKYKSKILYASPDDGGIELQKRAIEAFELPCHTFLIFSWPEDGLEESVVAEICDKLRNTLNQYEKKKVILVAKSDKLVHQIGLNRSVCGIIDESVTFKDFCQVSQSKLLKEKVVFQGKEVSLEELLETQTDQDYTKKLCSEILEVLVKEEQIRVGLEVRPLDEQFGYYYIDRNLIRINDEKGFGRKRTETISENKIYEMKDKVVVIADAAGMGKSTILSHLAVTIKNNNPHLWVIRINLSDYTGIFKNFQKKTETINIIDLLNSKDTKLSNQLEEVVFSMNKKVVIMMDGIDEISPNYTELVVNLLRQCQQGSNFDKVFVTTRPNMTQELESKLLVKSFTLLPFTERDQIRFHTEYWAHNLKLDSINKKKCETYAYILLRTMSSWMNLHQEGEQIGAMPLQIRMLAEIFQTNDRSEVSMDWEGCKEYLEGNGILKLPEKSNVAKIYEMFIEKKRNVFKIKGNPNGNTAANEALVDQFEECLACHRLLALEEILRKSECELFSHYQPVDRNVETKISKMGIVQISENRFYFVHRTFAEYFVAESLLSELQLQIKNQNGNFQKFFFDEILLKAKFKVVRTFFDNFLSKIVDQLPSNIFRSYRSLRYDIDLEDNYYLIHNMAREGCTAILELLFKCIDFEVIIGKGIYIENLLHAYFDQRVPRFISANTLIVLYSLVGVGGVNIYDDIHTPLLYATQEGHLEMVKFLVERGANVDPINSMRPLWIAINRSHFDMVKFMVQHGADIKRKNTKGGTILYKAISMNHVNMVEFLLDSTLECNRWDEVGPIIPYTFAYLGRLNRLESLVEEGFDVNRSVENQETIIFGAALGGQLDTIEYLVDRDVDINARDEKGNTMLHLTAMRPSLISTAKLLIELGINMNVKNLDGSSELHLAIRNLDMVKLLVENGAKVNEKNNRGQTALHIAAETGILETVEFLIENESDVNIRSNSGGTVLHSAAAAGQLGIVKFLVTRLGVDFNVTDNNGYTPLHSACECFVYSALSTGQLDTIKFLVEHHADYNIRKNDGGSVLHTAAMCGQRDIIEYFVELGVDVNISDDKKRTPLHVAALRDELNAAKCLVELGADVNLRDNKDCTPLHLSALNDKRDIVKFLSKGDIDNNIRGNDNELTLPIVEQNISFKYVLGRTTLHFAAEEGDLDVTKYLASLNVNLNITDDNGETPLHYAAFAGRLDAARCLVPLGSDVNIRDKNGLTTLHYAAMSGHRDLVQLFLDHGVGVNIREGNGHTALHFAAQEGYFDVVKYLVERDGDVNVADNEGRTALHLATLMSPKILRYKHSIQKDYLSIIIFLTAKT
ncbi:uncharacterized protein LOC108914374 [Anoplophora glabripennis]|uniref:uncharacterized protein LOC108914374 n=1 Tax=Anoplophora glabripennis TaxID=217634 RepID=UPI000C77AB34|nr:uncharacterized protein LOC108914374 [Anoplophora glabripennis]